MVKRYMVTGHVDGLDIGEYVLATDYDALLTERDLLLAVVETANKGHVCPAEICIRCDALSKALDAYYANKGDSDE